jgi:Bacterial SH3 domain
MPKVYGRPSIIAYWYIPAAVAVAIVVALGVIWGADQMFGGPDTSPAAGPTATPPETTAITAIAAVSPSPAQADATRTSTGPATPTRGSGTSTKFQIGNVVIVTGAGDCLNVRTAPGRSNDAIVCLKDGEEVTVTGGPESASDLQWWKVSTKLGDGWAAEDYLVKK